MVLHYALFVAVLGVFIFEIAKFYKLCWIGLFEAVDGGDINCINNVTVYCYKLQPLTSGWSIDTDNIEFGNNEVLFVTKPKDNGAYTLDSMSIIFFTGVVTADGR